MSDLPPPLKRPPEPNTKPVLLDHERGIFLDPANTPFDNPHAFKINYEGIHQLAPTVRQHEILYVENDPYAKHVTFHALGAVPTVVVNAFNWFAMTLTNYLRLIALVEVASREGWDRADLATGEHNGTIKRHCGDYVRQAVPEIAEWRNKVAAHHAITDPRKEDNIATLMMTIMDTAIFRYPYYRTGGFQYSTQGSEGELPNWAVTETHEKLSTRYWPESRLKPLPDAPPRGRAN
jgi:hypothetical protein